MPTQRALDVAPPGGMTASRPRGEETEISCAKDAELRDNDFNIGGHVIWDRIGQIDRQDQFEAEASAAACQTEYFALQRLPNRALYGPTISWYEFPKSDMQSAYTYSKTGQIEIRNKMYIGQSGC